MHLDAVEHTPSAPKGKRFGRNACIGRVAQGKRGGGMRVLGVFENLAGKRQTFILVAKETQREIERGRHRGI